MGMMMSHPIESNRIESNRIESNRIDQCDRQDGQSDSTRLVHPDMPQDRGRVPRPQQRLQLIHACPPAYVGWGDG